MRMKLSLQNTEVSLNIDCIFQSLERNIAFIAWLFERRCEVRCYEVMKDTTHLESWVIEEHVQTSCFIQSRCQKSNNVRLSTRRKFSAEEIRWEKLLSISRFCSILLSVSYHWSKFIPLSKVITSYSDISSLRYFKAWWILQCSAPRTYILVFLVSSECLDPTW